MSLMRVLITGITGFVGSHMAEHALCPGRRGLRLQPVAQQDREHRASARAHHPHRIRPAGRLLGAVARRDGRARTTSCTWPPRASWARRGRRPRRRSPTNILSQVNLLEAIAVARRSRRASCGGEQRGIRDGLRGRAAHQGDEPAPAALALRGEQGHAGRDGLPVLQELWPAHRAHAGLQPRGPPPRRRLRRRPTSPSRWPRSRRGCASPWSGWAISSRGATSPTSATSCAATGCSSSAASPARSTTSARAAPWSIQQVLDFLLGAVHGEGHRRRGRSGAPPALRRDDPRGRPVEDREGHGVEGGDSLRAHPQRSSSTTGGSGSGPRARADAAIAELAMRVALVHDWLTGMRGGERCLEVFCELFPDADLFTLLHVPGSVSPVDRAAPHRHLVHPAAAQARRPATATTCRCFPPPSAASISAATTSCCPRATRWPRASPCPRGRCTCATASRRCATCGISTTSTSARARAWATRAS